MRRLVSACSTQLASARKRAQDKSNWWYECRQALKAENYALPTEASGFTWDAIYAAAEKSESREELVSLLSKASISENTNKFYEIAFAEFDRINEAVGQGTADLTKCMEDLKQHLVFLRDFNEVETGDILFNLSQTVDLVIVSKALNAADMKSYIAAAENVVKTICYVRHGPRIIRGFAIRDSAINERIKDLEVHISGSYWLAYSMWFFDSGLDKKEVDNMRDRASKVFSAKHINRVVGALSEKLFDPTVAEIFHAEEPDTAVDFVRKKGTTKFTVDFMRNRRTEKIFEHAYVGKHHSSTIIGLVLYAILVAGDREGEEMVLASTTVGE